MAFQLADDILAGRTQDEEQCVYASLDILEGDKVVATAYIFQKEQFQAYVEWHHEEYKGNEELQKFIEEAQRELITFLLF